MIEVGYIDRAGNEVVKVNSTTFTIRIRNAFLYRVPAFLVDDTYFDEVNGDWLADVPLEDKYTVNFKSPTEW